VMLVTIYSFSCALLFSISSHSHSPLSVSTLSLSVFLFLFLSVFLLVRVRWMNRFHYLRIDDFFSFKFESLWIILTKYCVTSLRKIQKKRKKT
jgi:hypothetical protein